jgi:hypothetical protein
MDRRSESETIEPRRFPWTYEVGVDARASIALHATEPLVRTPPVPEFSEPRYSVSSVSSPVPPA